MSRLVFEGETGIPDMEHLFWVEIEGEIIGQIHASPNVAAGIHRAMQRQAATDDA